jgi:RNA polymerase sigma-70 factor, ECF subfamily
MTAGAVDDFQGAFREALFYGRGDGRPLIGEYSGIGDLANWLRSVVMRDALKILKREEKSVALDEAFAMLPADENPELEYLRARSASAFEEAFAEAVGGLSPRERNLLRQHYIDELTIEAVGRLYQVHRATAARWLADVRESVLRGVKEALRRRGALTDSELESLLRMARSGLDFSIARLLRP